MKSMFILFFSVFSLAAHAGPQVEPGPVQDMPKAAVDVSRILLSPGVKDCVQTIIKLPYEFLLSKVTYQGISPERTIYSFIGHAQSGDIGHGVIVMTVQSQPMRDAFGHPMMSYSCEVRSNVDPVDMGIDKK
jgi:hypothetical protein